MIEHDRCPPIDVIQAYVMGELQSACQQSFELHVAHCSFCARALEQEARFEMALHDVADQLAPELGGPRIRRATNLLRHGLGAIAAAASVLLVLGLFLPELIGNEERADQPEQHTAVDRALNAYLPAPDEARCDEPAYIAQREPNQRALWTELPDPIDPATCWSEDEGLDLVCAASEPLSG